MSSTEEEKEARARLRRIETRVTNMARWFGFDATKQPVNDPSQPVFVDKDEFTVYASPAATLGDVLLAVRRSNMAEEIDELPLMVNGLEVAVIDPRAHLNFPDYEDRTYD